MNLIQVLIGVAAAVFILLGSAHGWLTLKDIKAPKTFAPPDPELVQAMMASRLRIDPTTNLWRAWIGFNLSHSLGVVLFGVLLLIAAQDGAHLFANRWVEVGCMLMTVIYLTLSIKFWFHKPTIGCVIALICLMAAAVLSNA